MASTVDFRRPGGGCQETGCEQSEKVFGAGLKKGGFFKPGREIRIKTMAGIFVPAIALSLHKSRGRRSLFHPIHLVLAVAAAQLQTGNALHKLGELGIPVIPHVKILKAGVQLVAQFA